MNFCINRGNFDYEKGRNSDILLKKQLNCSIIIEVPISVPIVYVRFVNYLLKGEIGWCNDG